MTDNLDKLVAVLAESGTVATREQAERLAIRVSGSVDAYFEWLEHFRSMAKNYRAPPQPEGGVSNKFSDPIAYRVIQDRRAQP